MSSFQLYEFQALDRALSNADQTYLNSLSSRAEVTATRARYTYSYSDFRTKPLEVLDRCFDIMLYQASYGTRQLAIRIPKSLAHESHYQPYCVPYLIELRHSPQSIILNISISCESYGGWLSEKNRLPELIEIRSALLQGDLRVLYLAWLAAAYAEDGSFEWDTTLEPPVPPNLKKLSPALASFAEIFGIDSDLIVAAATQSKAASSPASEPIEQWIAALPERERNQYLLRVAQGENHVGLELMQRLRQQFGSPPTVLTATVAGRTFAQLEAASSQKFDEREQKEQATAEKSEQQRLKSLIPEIDNLWALVHNLLKRGQAKTYGEAIVHLKDLQAIAHLQNDSLTFQKRIQQIEQDFARKRSLIARLAQADLI